MQAYCEILHPTAVTHAVSVPFLSSKAHNLVVAKTSLLQIFEIRAVQATRQQQQQQQNAQKRLILVGEYSLAGTVTSLASVKALHTKAGGEALLVAVKDAKLSLLEWDPETHGPSTISIHYYEGDGIITSPWSPALGHCATFLTVDPNQRCAALKFGSNYLAILPFKQLGDDLVADEYDSDFDEPRPQTKLTKAIDGDNEEKHIPFAASFVLPLAALDSSLIYTIDLAFLHEYREPTLGVLSAAKSPSTALIHDRKDVISYTVFTLDIEQRARTPLLSVSGLPFDLWKLLPLPLPVGGALLVGANELIHVDQSAKTNAISVNEFAKRMSGFAMTDQSDLGLKLEDCVIAPLRKDSGDLLITLNTGQLIILSFNIDGRSVAGLSLHQVAPERGGNVLGAAASCAVSLGRDTIFIGSEDADSVLLSRDSKRPQLLRKRSHTEMLSSESASAEEESGDDDDLYGNDTDLSRGNDYSAATADHPDQPNFVVHDRLMNLASAAEPALGKMSQKSSDLNLVIPSGKGTAGALSILQKNIRPKGIDKFDLYEADNIWSFNALNKNKISKASNNENSVSDPSRSSDDFYLITTSSKEDGTGTSTLYQMTSGRFEPRYDSQFDSDCLTVDVGVICSGTRIVQISQTDIKTYNIGFGLEQVVPVIVDKSEADVKITRSSFLDPYILIFRSDSSVVVEKIGDNGKFRESDQSPKLQSGKWISGSLASSPLWGSRPLAFILSDEGGLHVFDPESPLEPVYQADSLCFLPQLLSPGQATRRSATRAKILELLVTNIGDTEFSSPFLIIRTNDDDIVIFQPYDSAAVSTRAELNLEKLRWLKVHTALAENNLSEEDHEETCEEHFQSKIRAVENLGGYVSASVFGKAPRLIMKDKSSLPKVFNFSSDATRALINISTPHCEKGLAALNEEGSIRTMTLPFQLNFTTGWAVTRVPLGQTVTTIGYDAESGLFAVGMVAETAFKLPDDDWHHEWAKEDISLRPKTVTGSIRLLRPEGWLTVNEFALEDGEIPLSLKILCLETSEITHERNIHVVVGTGIPRGEDLACNGKIIVLRITTVVPEEGKPETNKRLKVIAREEVRGSVTAISDIGNQGYLLAAQGQKCMVRGLKEDNSLLPVAFLDMQCYVTVLRNIKGTGLILAGDAIKGLWLCGFSEEPCKMRLFGKSRSNLEVIAGEFLPQDKQLHILIIDANCDIHVFEFKPEDPKSLSGQRLLQKSTFHLGHFPVSMTSLPSNASPISSPMSNGDVEMHDAGMDTQTPLSYILVTMQSGALGIVSPLDEQMYRRLGALQTHLTGVVEHCGGLNPRAYRAVESEGFGSKGILDGQVLKKWADLGSQRRSEACARIGASEWEIRTDLEFIGGSGLDYL